MRTRASASTRSAHRRTTAAAALLTLTVRRRLHLGRPAGDDSGGAAGPGAASAASDVAEARARTAHHQLHRRAAVPIDAPVSVSAAGRHARRRHGHLRRPATLSRQGRGRLLDVLGPPRARHRLHDHRRRHQRATAAAWSAPAASTPSTSRSTSRPTPRSRRSTARPSASGMPVIVTFDLPVTDRALFEKHMHVTSTPAQRGSWYWLSDREAHFRPATLLEGRHGRLGRPRRQQPARRQRHLRPGVAQHRLPHRRRPRLQGQRPDPPDAGLLQRRARCAPSRSPPASPASRRAPAPR